MAKKRFEKDYAAYIGFKIGSFIVSVLPLGLALWFGRIIGLCMYHFHPKRKRIAYTNLKAAFCKDKMPSELKDILKRTYKNYGQSVIETLRIPRVTSDYLKKYVKLEGRGNFDEAEARNKGIIFLSSHFGNWEFSSLKSAQEGYPVHILVRPQRYQKLNDLLNSYREKLGCKMISRGMPLREMIKALRENKIVGILADQDVGKSGVFIDLFGRPASHAIGAARFARDTDAAIVPAFIIRQKGPRHLIKLEKFITVPETGDRDADIKNGLKKYAKILESYIAQYPDQWMWVYTRWKSTPVRKVVILNDGKRGHLNQSLAAFNVIKKCRRDSGYRDEDTSLEIIDVKFKSRMSRSILALCTFFCWHAFQGWMKCLELCLTEVCYRSLMRTYADNVISCGSSLSAVNVFLSKENNSKNVVIMKPGIISLKNFEVAIIPKHDRPGKRNNVVVTEGSPNLISEETMLDGSSRIRNSAALTDKKRLGVLLGGDNPEFSFTTDLANKLIDQIEKIVEELDMELLITTSRRTPKAVENILKNRLNSNPRSKFLLIANEKNMDNAVSGILDLSEIVLVSGESMSMVSEAVTSGKPIVVFDLKNKKKYAKHNYAIERLALLDYIVRTPVDKIRGVIADLYQSKKTTKQLNDTERMYEKLYRII